MVEFKGQDPSLPGSTESLFLEGIIDSIKKNDKNKFEKVFSDYRNTNSQSYDEWKKSVLSKLYSKMLNGAVINENEGDPVQVQNNEVNNLEENDDVWLGGN